jgi:hypothetical protein
MGTELPKTGGAPPGPWRPPLRKLQRPALVDWANRFAPDPDGVTGTDQNFNPDHQASKGQR